MRPPYFRCLPTRCLGAFGTKHRIEKKNWAGESCSWFFMILPTLTCWYSAIEVPVPSFAASAIHFLAPNLRKFSAWWCYPKKSVSAVNPQCDFFDHPQLNLFWGLSKNFQKHQNATSHQPFKHQNRCHRPAPCVVVEHRWALPSVDPRRLANSPPARRESAGSLVVSIGSV